MDIQTLKSRTGTSLAHYLRSLCEKLVKLLDFDIHYFQYGVLVFALNSLHMSLSSLRLLLDPQWLSLNSHYAHSAFEKSFV